MKNIKIILLLIVVLFFIGFILPPFLSEGSCTPINHNVGRMSFLNSSLKIFKLDNGTYPSTKEGLEALMKNPNPKKYPNYAKDAYLEKVPVDGWENPFIYIHYKTEKGDDFQLISFGADGRYGGEGEDADIVYPPIKKRKLGFFEWLF